MLISVQSAHGVDSLREELPAAVQKHGFGVIGTLDLRAKLREKGQEYDRACLVFDVCNPAQARRVLTAEPRVSAALPCRISVFERDGGGAELVTIRPTAMIGMFGAGGELEQVAREVEEVMTAILDEVAEKR